MNTFKNSRLGFENPKLRNAPGNEIDGIYRYAKDTLSDMAEEMADREHESAYEQRRRQEEAQIRAAEQATYMEQAQLPLSSEQAAIQEKRHRTAWCLTPEAALNAVAWAEILSKPKALRSGYNPNMKPNSFH